VIDGDFQTLIGAARLGRIKGKWRQLLIEVTNAEALRLAASFTELGNFLLQVRDALLHIPDGGEQGPNGAIGIDLEMVGEVPCAKHGTANEPLDDGGVVSGVDVLGSEVGHGDSPLVGPGGDDTRVEPSLGVEAGGDGCDSLPVAAAPVFNITNVYPVAEAAEINDVPLVLRLEADNLASFLGVEVDVYSQASLGNAVPDSYNVRIGRVTKGSVNVLGALRLLSEARFQKFEAVQG
jgi:hypothetical protein